MRSRRRSVSPSTDRAQARKERWRRESLLIFHCRPRTTFPSLRLPISYSPTPLQGRRRRRLEHGSDQAHRLAYLEAPPSQLQVPSRTGRSQTCSPTRSNTTVSPHIIPGQHRMEVMQGRLHRTRAIRPRRMGEQVLPRQDHLYPASLRVHRRPRSRSRTLRNPPAQVEMPASLRTWLPIRRRHPNQPPPPCTASCPLPSLPPPRPTLATRARRLLRIRVSNDARR